MAPQLYGLRRSGLSGMRTASAFYCSCRFGACDRLSSRQKMGDTLVSPEMLAGPVLPSAETIPDPSLLETLRYVLIPVTAVIDHNTPSWRRLPW